MKILVLQLARFGDIYQSWPALRALKRTYPDSHITLLVREKFKAAADGLSEVDEVITMDTAKYLAPILFKASIDDALEQLSEFVDDLKEQQFDRIINLTFSPFSSYLVSAIAAPEAIVSGYTRFSDGYLSIPDDASAYFYAQSGVDRWSRVHVTDLFALIAGVQLQKEDWQVQIEPEVDLTIESPYLVVQPGASQAEKTLSPAQWANAVQTLLLETPYKIVVVGAKEERASFHWPDDERVVNMMGSCSLYESMTLIAKAQGFIGPDSVGLHMASLTGTPAFNISVGHVRFWETGPRSHGSRVLRFEQARDFELSRFFEEFMHFINGSESDQVYCLRDNDGAVYEGPATNAKEEFQWRLTQALYMQSDYPTTNDRVLLTAFSRISELADLGLEQIENIRKGTSPDIAISILNEVDHLLEKVCEFEPRVRPLTQWFLTQKLRIGPAPFEEVLEKTGQCFTDLQTITRVYALPVDWNDSISRKDFAWKP